MPQTVDRFNTYWYTMIRVDHLDHIALTVADLRRSVDWYHSVLGLERRFEQWETPVMMCAGNTCIALFPDVQSHSGSGVYTPPGRIGVRHFAFRIDRDMFAHAREVLRERGIDFDFENRDDIALSLYLRDPDGYLVELTTYEL